VLSQPIRLYDIDDAEAFVFATLKRFEVAVGFSLPDHEREDLAAEGLAILCDLAKRYEPHRAGYAQPGRFSGYAAGVLPRRLGDRWHAWHPEHRYVTDPQTGKRSWVYDMPPASYDALFGGYNTTGPDGTERRRDPLRGQVGCRTPGSFVPIPIPSRALEPGEV